MSYLVDTTNDFGVLPKEHHGPGRRRWQMAFRVINFLRFLDSLSKQVFKEKTKLLPSISQVAITVNDVLDHVPLININIDDNKKILITQMAKEKNHDSLKQLGGAKQVAALVQSDLNKGVSGREADLAHRRDFFGGNNYDEKLPLPSKSFFKFVVAALCKDQTIIIDLVFGIITLSFGAWYDGGSNIIAIFLVVLVSSFINFKNSTQLGKLLFDGKYSADEMKKVQVIRDENHQHISKFDIVVGDIVYLKIGDEIPADGLFLKGFSLKVYESSFTGEKYHVEIKCTTNPFLLSGAEVTNGFGFMLVTAVGINTYQGDHQLMNTINLEQHTPLQERLHKLVSCVAKFGLSVAMLIFTFSMIHYFAGNTRDQLESKTKVKDLFNSILTLIGTSVSIVMMATSQSLPLAVTLYLAQSVKPMMKNEKANLRKLSACETMASVTTICTGPGILTWNHMEVEEFWLGKSQLNKDEASMRMLDPQVFELLQEGAVLNSSIVSVNDLLPRWSGANPTEKAIISWAASHLSVDFNKIIEQRCKITHVQAFNSEEQTSSVTIRKSDEKSTHAHWKGDAEKILAVCSTYYVKKGGALVDMDEEERKEFEAIIRNMEVKGLRCVALAHKICRVAEEENHEKKLKETGFALLGLLGLKNPCRPGAKAAVESCRKAKVTVKMITGDSPHTARAIARECGILDFDLNEDDLDKAVVEGVELRNYSEEERIARVDDIRVLARSSPSDKCLMIECLKKKGHDVVAVTGDGTNDSNALEKADVGLFMGIQGADMAKESSDIVIFDDNFTSILTVLMWGRCVYNNIQKLIQFQLSVIAAALAINFVAAIFSGEIPLTSVQLLWVNLIMDTMGTLALATLQPIDNELMTKPPVGRSEPLVTKNMWWNLIAQFLCQVTMLLALQFKAKSIFGVNENVKNTMVFNTIVFFQIFNKFNARKLENNNIFEGIFKNKPFLTIIGFTIIVQVAMVELLGKFSGSQRLNCAQWGACVAIAAVSLPVDFLVKHITISN